MTDVIMTHLKRIIKFKSEMNKSKLYKTAITDFDLAVT